MSRSQVPWLVKVLYTHNPFTAGNFHEANGVSFSYVVGISQRSSVVAIGLIFFDPVRGWLADFKSLEDIRRIDSGRFPATDPVENLCGIYGDTGRESFTIEQRGVTAGVVFLGLCEDDPVQR